MSNKVVPPASELCAHCGFHEESHPLSYCTSYVPPQTQTYVDDEGVSTHAACNYPWSDHIEGLGCPVPPAPQTRKCVTCPHPQHSGPCTDPVCLCTRYPELHEGEATPPQAALPQHVPTWPSDSGNYEPNFPQTAAPVAPSLDFCARCGVPIYQDGEDWRDKQFSRFQCMRESGHIPAAKLPAPDAQGDESGLRLLTKQEIADFERIIEDGKEDGDIAEIHVVRLSRLLTAYQWQASRQTREDGIREAARAQCYWCRDEDGRLNPIPIDRGADYTVRFWHAAKVGGFEAGDAHCDASKIWTLLLPTPPQEGGKP